MPKAAKVKNSKASHLYTDDNPETTLHGTGFRDKATALHTIELVSQRSLTYQFQTINTMLYRARGHPHKTAGILEAIEVFADWTSTYKDRKAALKSFPLMKKEKVEQYLKAAEEHNEEHEDQIDVDFATRYISLPSKKRLANTLLDPAHPEREDLEIKRYKELCDLTSNHRDESSELTRLRCRMYAYDPK